MTKEDANQNEEPKMTRQEFMEVIQKEEEEKERNQKIAFVEAYKRLCDEHGMVLQPSDLIPVKIER